VPGRPGVAWSGAGRQKDEREEIGQGRWIRTMLAIVDGLICNTGMEWLKRHAYYSWEFCRTENVQFKDTANYLSYLFWQT
jgi:hypothetical protein